MFIGRRSELAELNKLYNKSSFQMAVIYGRRRIGKTRLIQEFMKDKPAVYMTAVEAGIAINLELLSTSIYLTFLGEEEATMMPSFKDFRAALQYITKKPKSQRSYLLLMNTLIWHNQTKVFLQFSRL
ncbi:MAG: AAA family ATPase [Veillonella parvula]